MKRFALVIAALAVLVTATRAAFFDRVWSGAGGDSDWHNSANWEPSEASPQPGERVLLTDGAATIDTATPLLALLVVSNASLTVKNWSTSLNASEIRVENRGTLKLPSPFTEEGSSNRIHLVCDELTVAEGGVIDASGGGYAGGVAKGDIGAGPGGGPCNSATSYGSGGSYGGLGGRGSSGGTGETYGAHSRPLEPGSGGGGVSAGAGGGAVLIEATERVTIDGTINADGKNATSSGGGGSGGAIAIFANKVVGSGLLTANGGTGSSSGGGNGGGGRIALLYNAAAQALLPPQALRFSAAPGVPTASEPVARYGASGTLWLPDTTFCSYTMANFIDVVIHGITEYAVNNLSLENRRIEFGEPGFVLQVAGDVSCGLESTLVMPPHATMAAGGDVTFGSGSGLIVHGGITNETSPAYGASVAVGGTLSVAANAWLLPCNNPTNLAGGSVRFSVSNLVVATGGGFNATGAGFIGGKAQYASGLGPGAGIGSGGSYGGGGGHGGQGGTGSSGAGGVVYGSFYAPLTAGSGGGGSSGGDGGGVIWIEAAADIDIEGTLNADGASGVTFGGGGAGGAILLAAQRLTLSENALISARGGVPANPASYTGGGGGGGRIAFIVGARDGEVEALLAGEAVPDIIPYEGHAPLAVPRDVAGGIGKSAVNNGAVGTVSYLRHQNTTLLEVVGTPENMGESVPYGYGSYPFKTFGIWITNNVATPTTYDSVDSGWVLTGWQLATADGELLSEGDGQEASFCLTEDRVLTWCWTNICRLAVSASAEQGSVNSAAVNGWYTNMTTIAGIYAQPHPGYLFSHWYGDITEEQATQNPLAIIMDQPRELLAVFYSVAGVTKLWHGTGNWEDSANWTPAGVPGVYDDVIIASGEVLYGALAQTMASLQVSEDARLLFSNWETPLTAATIEIEGGGTVALLPAFTDTQSSNRIHFICDELTVAEDGVIDASGGGYAGGVAKGDIGAGPGGGPCNSATSYGSGGSYGGLGGRGSSGGMGETYGAHSWPLEPGSGGGGVSAGAGGGAVWIEATGCVTIDGTINADGKNATSSGGGGSGGAIAIFANKVVGSGLLTANGGTGSSSGGGNGGGGRIALLYNAAAQALLPPQALRFSAAPGVPHSSHSTERYGASGTLWLPDTTLFSAEMGNFIDVVIHGVVAYSASGMRFKNRRIEFGEPGFLLQLSETMRCGANSIVIMPPHSHLIVGGDLVLADGGELYVYAGITNETSAAYGALVDVKGAIQIAAVSWIKPCLIQTDLAAAAPCFKAANLVIAAAGGFNSDGRGFCGSHIKFGNGFGPGGGIGTSGTYGGGGGYGGRGGNGASGVGGGEYGLAQVALLPGSGGGGIVGGDGGGVIWLEIREKAIINGVLTVDGATGTQGGSGGSGGGIYLSARRLEVAPEATISANGAAPLHNDSGGGGGGRISVWYGEISETDRQLLLENGAPKRVLITESHPLIPDVVTVEGGVNSANAARNGSIGTVRFVTVLPPPGTLFMLR